MKMFRTNKGLADALHKGFVLSCLALTAYGMGVLGLRVGDYFVNVKPQLDAKKRREEEALLAEGRQQESQDSAPVLRT